MKTNEITAIAAGIRDLLFQKLSAIDSRLMVHQMDLATVPDSLLTEHALGSRDGSVVCIWLRLDDSWTHFRTVKDIYRIHLDYNNIRLESCSHSGVTHSRIRLANYDYNDPTALDRLSDALCSLWRIYIACGESFAPFHKR